MFMPLEGTESCLNQHQQHRKTLEEVSAFVSKKWDDGLICALENARQCVEGEWACAISNDCLGNLVKSLGSRHGNERECAGKVLEIVAEAGGDPVRTLTFCVEAILERISYPSEYEEIKAVTIRIFQALLKRSEVKNELLPHMDSSVIILKTAIMDSCPCVKRIGLECVTSLAWAEPNNFHLQAGAFLEPLENALKHKHSAVRMSCVKAFGTIARYGSRKEDVRTVCWHLAQGVMDENPRVRLTVAQEIKSLMMDHPDRYSYYDILTPLLLSSNIDDNPEVSDACVEMWHEVGRKYEEENYAALKDELDFEQQSLPPNYPKQWRRPPLGCRAIVKEHAARIFPAVLRDMKDWLDTTRIKSSQLLYILILNCENNFTRHVANVLPAIVEMCCDEPPQFSNQVISCAELVGIFTRTTCWCEIILDGVEDGKLPQSLIVLDSLLRTCQRENVCETLPGICDRLASSQIDQEGNVNWLLKCVESVVTCADANAAVNWGKLFQLICVVNASSADEKLVAQSEECFSRLAGVLNLATVQLLFDDFFESAVSNFKKGFEHWTVKSTNCRVFLMLMTRGSNVEDERFRFLEVCGELCKDGKCAEMRFKMFTTIAKIFQTNGGFSADFTIAVVQDIILPNLRWHPGKTASALMSSAAACLSVVLRATNKNPTQGKITRQVTPALWPALLSILHHDNKTIRYGVCNIFGFLLNTPENIITEEQLEDLSTKLLERLDDPDNRVRFESLITLSILFKRSGSGTHHFNRIQQMLETYLDDDNVEFREKVFELLTATDDKNFSTNSW